MGNICSDCKRGDFDDPEKPKYQPHKLKIAMNPESFFDDMPQEEIEIRKRRSRSTIAVNKLVSYKHLRGFKQVKNIKEIYTWERELGAGQFGTVHEAEMKGGTRCAIKVIHKTKVAEAKVY